MALDTKDIIVLYSGGIDSTACLHFYKSQAYPVKALFIDYGQAARNQEQKAAKTITNEYGIALEVIKYQSDRTFSSGEIFGRNTFLLSCALLSSVYLPSIIAIGVHDGTNYFDCSTNYINQINLLFENLTHGKTKIHAPFVSLSKGDIFNYCKEQNLNLSATYSCELGTNPVCGKCKSCMDRKVLEC